MPAIETAHFHEREFASPNVPRSLGRVPVPARYHGNLRKLMVALEVIREALGGFPVKVISGYRTPKYNAQNKGRASKSLHLTASAADIVAGLGTPASVYWAIYGLRAEGKIPRGGLAAYPTFVHYDIRGWNAGWRAAPKRPWGCA